MARWVRPVVSLDVISTENDAGTRDTSQPESAAKCADEPIKFVPAKSIDSRTLETLANRGTAAAAGIWFPSQFG